MAQTINTNIGSTSAARYAAKAQGDLSTSMSRLASGMRINSAKDDAAGQAISERMTSQVRGLSQASRNANDGISMAQTAEGALGNISENLQRIRELAVQSANATNSDTDRAALNAEAKQLISEVQRVGTESSFNGTKLLDGSFGTKNVQVGANAGETIGITSMDARTTSMGSNTSTTTGTLASKVATAGANVAANGIAAAGAGFRLSNAAGSTADIAYAADSDMKTIAAAISSAGRDLGITAKASNSAQLSDLSAGGAISFKLNNNDGSQSTISANISDVSNLSALADAVNNAKDKTGITATFANGDKAKLVLTGADGKDIAIDDFTNATNAGATLKVSNYDAATNTASSSAGSVSTLTDGNDDSTTVTGKIDISSSKGTMSWANAGADVFAAATGQTDFKSVASIDISTADGATSALKTIDAALGQVNDGRASLGATQNRLSSTVSNVESTSENLQAARSRVQDTDYATESSKMSRTQVLAQAANAMLAQANQSSSQVMSLLR